MSFMPSPRSDRSPPSTVARSSAVASRTVAKRQCSTSSSSRNMPRWVCVLPTSIASSMRARSKHADPLDALSLEPRERVVEASAVGQREVGIELQQGDEHEAAREHVAVRQGQAIGLQLDVVEQEKIDVDDARPVPNL